jgi:hypothetical protein
MKRKALPHHTPTLPLAQVIRTPLFLHSVLSFHCPEFWALCGRLRLQLAQRQSFIDWLQAPQFYKQLKLQTRCSTLTIENIDVVDLSQLCETLFGSEYTMTSKFENLLDNYHLYQFFPKNAPRKMWDTPIAALTLQVDDHRTSQVHSRCEKQVLDKIRLIQSVEYVDAIDTLLQAHVITELAEIILQYAAFTTVQTKRYCKG